MSNLLILVPFFSVILLSLIFRVKMKGAAFILGAALSVLQVYLAIFYSNAVWNNSPFLFSNFLKLNLVVDNLSRVMLLSIGIVSFVTVFAARYIIRDEGERFNFINLLLIILAGLNGIVLVRDIFSLYVFMEVVAVVSFILIAFNKDIRAFEGAYKYIVLSTVATVLMLTSIALLVLIAGSTEFSAVSQAIKNSPHGMFVMSAAGLFICGLFIKAGIIPFHGWLPDVYSEAPPPASILLAGIATKTVGIYTLIRLVSSVFCFDSRINYVLMFVGVVSIVVAALASLGQNDFKRMLAYSSISQVGYIVLGLGCGTPLGLAGCVFHLFNHSIFKSLLFVNAAAVEFKTGSRDMNKISGLASGMPITATTSVLAGLSAAGIPPLSGFWSKLIIIIALWGAGFYGYAVIAALASILTLAYILSMQRRVFFSKLPEGGQDIKEVGFTLALPALILGAITVGVGILFPFILNTFLSSFAFP